MPTILIVGAGPAGLATAWSLTSAGTRPSSIRLIDARPNPIDGHDSRALGIHVRTLEVLGPSLAGRLVRRGKAMGSFTLCDGTGGAMVALDLAVALAKETTAYKCVLALSQGAVEEEMRGALSEVGVQCEWGVRFSGLVAEEGKGGAAATATPPTSLAARLDRGDGSEEETIHPAFIVGADGVNSAVRAAAGVTVARAARPAFSYLADVQLEGPGLDAALSQPHAFLGRRGLALCIPLERPGWARLVFDGPPAAASGGARPALDEAGVRALFTSRLPFAAGWTGGGGAVSRPPPTLAGASLTIRSVHWTSAFRVVEHIAPAFRAGRVFLAGDAAHAHAPTGGQGLNLGVQDGANLGWKLALVLAGRVAAPDPLLDSYSAERRPPAAVRVKATGLAWRVLVETKSPLLVAARNAALRALGSSPRLVSRLNATAGRALSMLAVQYAPDGVVVRDDGGGGGGGGGAWAESAPRPGCRAPLAVAGLAERVEAAAGRHVLVAWGGGDGGVGSSPPALPWADVLADPPRELVAALGGEPAVPGAVAVRPDGVIGWRGGGMAGAAAWWARLVGG